MNLTPREKDKLLIAMAAMVARRRLERGRKLNHPEAIALIADSVRTVKSIACYGFGWRGWGVYPGLHPACLRVAPAYVAPGYVAAAPVYAAPAYPVAGRCWIPATPDGRAGYWAAC